MTGVYIILTGIFSGCLFFFRRRTISYILVWSFILLQWFFTIYQYLHRDETDLIYFTPDALSLIFLLILSVVAIPAFYHSYVYFNHHKNTPRERAIYYSAMLILIGSLSVAYLSNHIGITWVFVEMTTLSASVLIYHRRNSRTLEATWKYIFVCSISITLVFIGILFLSIAIQGQGLNDLTYDSS